VAVNGQISGLAPAGRPVAALRSRIAKELSAPDAWSYDAAGDLGRRRAHMMDDPAEMCRLPCGPPSDDHARSVRGDRDNGPMSVR
jgi:hypothetical protein